MATPLASTREMAGRLVAASRNAPLGTPAADPSIPEAFLVSDRLRESLIKFAGVEGCASLLSRALMLAGAEAPSLKNLKVGPDGRLKGSEQHSAGTDAAAGREAAIALTAHLLQLLIIFIGEPLTLLLVRDAWSDTSLNLESSKIEGDE